MATVVDPVRPGVKLSVSTSFAARVSLKTPVSWNRGSTGEVKSSSQAASANRTKARDSVRRIGKLVSDEGSTEKGLASAFSALEMVSHTNLRRELLQQVGSDLRA